MRSVPAIVTDIHYGDAGHSWIVRLTVVPRAERIDRVPCLPIPARVPADRVANEPGFGRKKRSWVDGEGARCTSIDCRLLCMSCRATGYQQEREECRHRPHTGSPSSRRRNIAGPNRVGQAGAAKILAVVRADLLDRLTRLRREQPAPSRRGQSRSPTLDPRVPPIANWATRRARTELRRWRLGSPRLSGRDARSVAR